jgi:AP-3 complex subunit delta
MDLFSDLLPMLNHSKAYVRKKAVLVMYKIFLQYPDALRVVFPRLREKLDDEDICMFFDNCFNE